MRSTPAYTTYRYSKELLRGLPSMEPTGNTVCRGRVDYNLLVQPNEVHLNHLNFCYLVVAKGSTKKSHPIQAEYPVRFYEMPTKYK